MLTRCLAGNEPNRNQRLREFETGPKVNVWSAQYDYLIYTLHMRLPDAIPMNANSLSMLSRFNSADPAAKYENLPRCGGVATLSALLVGMRSMVMVAVMP